MWAMIVYEVEQKGRKWSNRLHSKGKNTSDVTFVPRFYGSRSD